MDELFDVSDKMYRRDVQRGPLGSGERSRKHHMGLPHFPPQHSSFTLKKKMRKNCP